MTMIDNAKDLPENVRAVMREVLAEGLELARKRESPGDGYLSFVGEDRTIGKGMFDGGWKVQASIVEDARFYDRPHVVVHAYSDSTLSKGSIAAPVKWTVGDRRALAEKRVATLRAERKELDKEIAALCTEWDLA